MKDKILKHYQIIPFRQNILARRAFVESLTYYVLKNYDFRNRQICDIGCSASFIGNFIKLNYPEYRYLGLDFNLRAIEIAHSRGIKVMAGDNMSLPLLNECSDFTISEGVIHHAQDPYKCFQELIRITKKGGYISLLVYNKNSYYFYLFKLCKPLRVIYQSCGNLNRCIFLKLVFSLYYYSFLFFISKILQIKEKIPLREIMNNFHDQILNPRVYFFKENEIKNFCKNRLNLIKFKKKYMGKSLLFLFNKVSDKSC